MPRVDTREKASWRTEPLIRAGWQLARLDWGDYDGFDPDGRQWAVEHKVLSGKSIKGVDHRAILSDMKDGRLQRQCRALAEHVSFPILMIEGHLYRSGDFVCGSQITWSQFWNQLRSIQDWGCRIEFTISHQDTIERLLAIASYYSKDIHHSMLRGRSGDSYLEAVSLIKGIDQHLGKSLKANFPSLQDLANAEIGELTQTKGVGEILAKRIYSFWRGTRLL
jgi:ERCC4-type nuclease